MLAVDEPRPGAIRAVLTNTDGTVRAESEKDMTILWSGSVKTGFLYRESVY